MSHNRADYSNFAHHTLGVAFDQLEAELRTANSAYKNNLTFNNPTPVIRAIERFVGEIDRVPEWLSELEFRVSLIEKTCGPGSEYDLKRRRALDEYTEVPTSLTSATFALRELRKDKNIHPLFVSEVERTRGGIEAVLREPTLQIPVSARTAFENWRDTCFGIQSKAERLEVDGCWYLYHVYKAAFSGASERSDSATTILQTDMGGAHLERLLAAAESVLAWTREHTDSPPDRAPSVGQEHLEKAEKGPHTPRELHPFEGGKLVFSSNRVELCGVTICAGTRSQTRRRLLELLAVRTKSGKFAAYSQVDLTRHLDLASPAGAIRDLRKQITKVLAEEANIECGPDDVILSGDQGYRFSNWLSVQFADESTITDITDIDGSKDVPNVRNDDVRDPDDVRDDVGARKTWILQQLAEGVQLKAPAVAQQFDCSVKTAQRDLTALKDGGKIEYVGDPRTGYYRLCQDPPPDL